MLLTITNTTRPATDLGYLLHKHPGRVQSFPLACGKAHVFYPEATANRCTVALLLDVDPVGLLRGAGGDRFALEQYVNDRPYVASSFLSVAIGDVFRAAMAGRSPDRPELAELPLPLTARLAAVPVARGREVLDRLFAPLGYEVSSAAGLLDDQFPEWGASPYHAVELRGTVRLRELLTHLYVLIPVLDGDKHYWVGDDEVAKLLRHGEGWLAGHPERELIARRYLKRQRGLVDEALRRLDAEQEAEAGAEAGDGEVEAEAGPSTEAEERQPGLNEQRLGAVLGELRRAGARSVVDLGCGEGQLLRLLLADRQFERIVGVDVAHRTLERAKSRLRLEQTPSRDRERLTLLVGALTYRDRRLEGFDAAACVEVIEHLDPNRLDAFERVVFECACPTTVVLTTPNADYSVRYANLGAGKLRHRDHRFEWSRTRFREWASGVGARRSYSVRFAAVGVEDPEFGSPTQMAVFSHECRRVVPE